MVADQHDPVLLTEVLDALSVRPDGVYIDATFGRGGHTRTILEHLGSQGCLLAFDRDPEAIGVAKSIAAHDKRLKPVHGCFTTLGMLVDEADLSERIAGVFFDLGVSSPQLADAERGFSFQHDGPLDMRMDPSDGISAGQWLACAAESEIAAVLRSYGEERQARRIARAICTARRDNAITSTAQLADLITALMPRRPGSLHPATKCFQAIRIKINDELSRLESGLVQALDSLEPGGRLVVISFHSLEDRIVKRFMRDQSRGDQHPPELPVIVNDLRPRVKLIGKRIRATTGEVERNPRARSATLRIAEKLQ